MGERNGRARDDLLRIICHEVRGALTPLRSWVRLLRRGDVSPETTAHAVDVIDRSLQILSRLAADLEMLTDVRVSELPMSPGPLDLRDVVLATIGLVTQEAAIKGVILDAAVPPAPVPVVGDPVRLAQVIANLVGNAVKFTDPAGTVLVELQSVDDRARLVVRDSGAGIGPEFLPHVFEKFAREAPGDGAHRGRGLGLHVVKHLVHQHHGTIEAYSAGPGCGSRFVVTLPLAETLAA